MRAGDLPSARGRWLLAIVDTVEFFSSVAGRKEFQQQGVLVLIQCASCSKFNRVPASRAGHNAKCAACKASLLPLAHPIAVGSSADFDELVHDSPIPVLVDFWAAWCGPCRMVAPELVKLASTRGGGLIVAKIDTEALPEVAARFHIQGIPTLILFRGGKESARLSGAMSASAIATKLAL